MHRSSAERIEVFPEQRVRPVWIDWPRALFRFTRRKPLGAFGGLIVTSMIILGVFAPFVAPYDYDATNIPLGRKGPSLSHLAGTDKLGRDEMSRIIFGARVSIFIGFGAVALAQVLATTVGTISGYYGGKLDILAQRFVDIWQSFPALVLLISIMSIIGPGQTQVVLALGFLFSARASRIIRGSVIGVRNNVYMEAARAIGAGDTRIIARYVLPNVFPTILVIATIELGAVILTEATLSFLGFGIPPPFPAWGRMLNENRNEWIFGPWLAIAPGLAITLAVFGFNMLGDALRDVLDPRMRGAR